MLLAVSLPRLLARHVRAEAAHNDLFLQMVKAETHRGLEGRALAGFSTGGRVYGYSTVEEPNPPDKEHPRKTHVVNDSEAQVVRRIFELFVAGHSTKKIAAQLNAEGIPAPYDGGHGAKRHGHGWPHTTIRLILKNERYTGRWVWNASKWIRVPGKKSRRRVMRPDDERVVQVRPVLAIVPRELWDAAQNRVRRGPKRGGGRPAGAGKNCHIFSGLLKCGVCGAGMSVVGQRLKKGVRYAQIGCNGNHSRGDAVCANKLSVSERLVVSRLLGSLQELVTSPELLKKFTAGVRKRLEQQQTDNRDDKLVALERQAREADRRVRNVTESLANLGWNDAIAEKLKEEQDQRAVLQTQLTAARQKHEAFVLPTDAVIKKHVTNLVKLLTADPARGREALGRCLRPFVLTPEGEQGKQHYRAVGALSLSLLLKTETPASNDVEAGVSGYGSCGDRI
jgi:site-specific DNA recombinase